MASALDKARVDLARKEQIWLAARAESARARSIGEPLAAQALVIGEGKHTWSQEEVAEILCSFEASIAEVKRAGFAETEAHQALTEAHRTYKTLELEWATVSISKFHAVWYRAHFSEGSRG